MVYYARDWSRDFPQVSHHPQPGHLASRPRPGNAVRGRHRATTEPGGRAVL